VISRSIRLSTGSIRSEISVLAFAGFRLLLFLGLIRTAATTCATGFLFVHVFLDFLYQLGVFEVILTATPSGNFSVLISTSLDCMGQSIPEAGPDIWPCRCAIFIIARWPIIRP